jgi:glycosyltransferase involved in cell wall biosynthesis
MTFALFAYNQEEYIGEAVEGGSSQSYAPLEFILFDDGSGDRTFENMQEMAETYEGSHEVIARCNSFNLGTALHVQSAFDESSGQLFAVAAGDDIRPYGSCLCVCRALCVVRSGYAVG